MHRRTVGYQPVNYAPTPIRAMSLQERRKTIPSLITNEGKRRKETKPRPLQSTWICHSSPKLMQNCRAFLNKYICSDIKVVQKCATILHHFNLKVLKRTSMSWYFLLWTWSSGRCMQTVYSLCEKVTCGPYCVSVSGTQDLLQPSPLQNSHTTPIL